MFVMEKMNLRERRRQKRIEESMRTVKKAAVIVLAFAVIFTAILFGVFFFRDSEGAKTDAADSADTDSMQDSEVAAGIGDDESQHKALETLSDSENSEDSAENATTPSNIPDNTSVSDNDPDPTIYFSHENWINSHPKVKGIYVTGSIAGSERFEEMLSLADNTDINTFVIDIKNDGGEVTYLMDEGTKPAEYDCCVNFIRDIDGMMATLKEHNIYTIARIVCFKDPLLAKARGDLALLDSAGNPVTDGAGNA